MFNVNLKFFFSFLFFFLWYWGLNSGPCARLVLYLLSYIPTLWFLLCFWNRISQTFLALASNSLPSFASRVPGLPGMCHHTQLPNVFSLRLDKFVGAEPSYRGSIVLGIAKHYTINIDISFFIISVQYYLQCIFVLFKNIKIFMQPVCWLSHNLQNGSR
jgi:hypothetical protein